MMEGRENQITDNCQCLRIHIVDVTETVDDVLSALDRRVQQVGHGCGQLRVDETTCVTGHLRIIARIYCILNISMGYFNLNSRLSGYLVALDTE